MAISSLNSRRSGAAVRVVTVSAILFLIALAALAAPQYQNRDRDHDRDRDRDHDRTILILSHERVAQDFGGGNGGRPAPDALCEPGFVAVGFHVQTGEYYNQAWLDCAPMRLGWIARRRAQNDWQNRQPGRPSGFGCELLDWSRAARTTRPHRRLHR